jgi:hypothetical protein
MGFSPERRETTLIAPIARDPCENCGLERYAGLIGRSTIATVDDALQRAERVNELASEDPLHAARMHVARRLGAPAEVSRRRVELAAISLAFASCAFLLASLPRQTTLLFLLDVDRRAGL